MEVRDPVHGSIAILSQETPVIRADFFQRLRNIKQLGFSEYVFPGATHTRFLHSIGVMHVGSKVFEKLFSDVPNSSELRRIRQTFKLACLLHDIGHAPLSHSTESVMPSLEKLNIPKEYLSKNEANQFRQATHEDYTIKSIADSSLSESFKKHESDFGVIRKYIADLIRGETDDESYFYLNGKSYFPLLHQLVSSELDCDRMDYLLRDSYFCGVSYGSYDLDWLIDNLDCCEINGRYFLGISERAVVTFDDFLLSRYHMFLMVYFHYRAVCLEQLLYRFFETSPDEYKIPANIEAYREHDDHHLMKVLRNSNNRYAQAIVKNDIPKKIFESFNDEQLKQLIEIEKTLKNEGIEYIRSSSQGRLSKYYSENLTENKYPLKVIRKQTLDGHERVLNINQSTELFQRFSKSHSVNRIHCNFHTLDKKVQDKILKITKGSYS